MNLIKKTLIFFMHGIRPMLGPSVCRYTVSCTEYAEMQIKEKPFFPALWAIIKRLLSCNPFKKF